MNISKDLSIYVLWKYLPIEDILKYCNVNKELKSICNDPEVWRYLLKRDYKIDSSTNETKKEYMRLYLNYRDYVSSINDKILFGLKHKDREFFIRAYNSHNMIYRPYIENDYHITKYMVKPLKSDKYTMIRVGILKSVQDKQTLLSHNIMIDILKKEFHAYEI